MKRTLLAALAALVLPVLLTAEVNIGLIKAVKKRVGRVDDKVAVKKAEVALEERILRNRAPALAWTSEAGYAADGLEPETGGTTADFFYRVKYSDPDGDVPAAGYPRVHIRKSGAAVSGSPFAMAYVSGTPDSGAIYAFSRTLAPAGGDYAYYFEAMDLLNASAAWLPTGGAAGPVVTNVAPALAWTGEAGYAADGLDPETGGTATQFVYRVKYSDPDSDPPAPGYPRVHVRKGGVEISSSPFSMTRVSGSNFSGVLYTHSMALAPSGGDYSYHFDALDLPGDAAAGAPLTETAAPAPAVANIISTLSWTAENGYAADGLDPEDGGTYTPFFYRVKYTDADNDPPAAGYPKLHIKKSGTDIAGSPFSMSYASGTYNGGAIFTYSGTLALGNDYTYYFSGRDLVNADSLGTPLIPKAAPNVTNWTQVSCGGQFSRALKTDGTLWAWGFNGAGALGVGDIFNRLSPVQVESGTDWAALAGNSHTLAIKTGGSLWAWGMNGTGQLGLGDFSTRDAPVRVGTDTDWAALGGGNNHSLAVKTGGGLWAWGFNGDGALGLGDFSTRNAPVRVGADSDWAMAAGGYSHSKALKTDGSLWAWGLNNYGQLGLGDNANRDVPVRVGTDNDWDGVFGGDYYSLAIKTDGSLWAWGLNSDGQLGLGDTADRDVPTRVGTDSDWAAVSGGYSHALAVKTDGTLWAWGKNGSGQLGLGNTVDKSSPTRVGSAADWAWVSAGNYHSLAIKTAGSLWSWGANEQGQGGVGDVISADVPRRVGN